MSLALVSEPHASESLARLANSEHSLAQEATATWFVHAVNAGRYLVEVKELVAPGEWDRWVKENLAFSLKTSQVYRTAFLLEDKIRESGDLSTRGVLAARKLAPFTIGKRGAARGPSPDLVSYIQRCRESGEPWARIAGELGTSYITVRSWADPQYAAERRAYETRRRRQLRERKSVERRVLDRARRDSVASAARRQADPLGDAYSYLRKALLSLQNSLETASGDKAAAVREAMTMAHKAEDAIVAALRGKPVR